MAGKLGICLWFAGEAEAAARFYCDTFPESEMGEVARAPADFPSGKAGDVLTVNFTLLGQQVLGLNGARENGFTDAVSFQVFTDTQEETDRYWTAIESTGGQPMACSWIKDRFGVRFQIVPRVLMDALGHSDEAVRARVFMAMQQMVKIDHAGIEAAIAGG